MPKPADLATIEERREATAPARAAARFKAAEARIQKIVDAAPPLSADQRTRLALLLTSGTP